jgi:hypothetical protein
MKTYPMNNNVTHGLKICFISNSQQSYLTDYIHLSKNDYILYFSFENLNLSELKNYNPDIIIVDEYFKNRNYNSIIKSIKLNFKHIKTYLLSPEYSNYNSTIQSLSNKNHFYSNFNIEVLHKINMLTGNNQSNYLEAS